MLRELKKYDVVLVDFGKNIDSEQSGIRPAVIIQNDTGNYFSGTTLVMPFTSSLKSISQPTHALFTKGRDKGLTNDSILLGECMRQVSKRRIIKPLGAITNQMEKKEIKRVYEANFGDEGE